MNAGRIESTSPSEGKRRHLDAERRIVEIGYFVLPAARGRGVATAETGEIVGGGTLHLRPRLLGALRAATT